jgi:hypothetical protein
MVTQTHRDQDGDAAAKLPREEARQGQNVRGMTTVLVVGVVLLAIAYAIMLAFQSTPVTPDGVEQNAAPAIESPETAQSPS